MSAIPVRHETAHMACVALALAAAPAFAIMALLTALSGVPDMSCMAARDVPLPGGMVPMYLLMSLFHLSPWLRLAFTASGRASSR